MSAFDEASEWVDAVWGERTGHFHFAFGVGGHFNANDKYEFDHWLERHGRWPDDRGRFLEEAIDKAGECDVYVAPYLRSNASRKKGNALPSDILYGDLDERPSGQLMTPGGVLLLGPGGLLVESGRGLHPYLRLDEELEPAELERLNRHLAHALGADAGWAENKVLRLPGTWNHKGRARGDKSAPVNIIRFRPAMKDWTQAELVGLLGPFASVLSNGDQPIEPVMPEYVPAHLLARLEEEPSGNRSKQTMLFVLACVDAGLPDSAVMALALRHRPTKEKYGSDDPARDRRTTEIGRVLSNVRPEGSERSRGSDAVDSVGSEHGISGAASPNGVTESAVKDSVTPDAAAPRVDEEPRTESESDSDADFDSRPFALSIRDFIALEREQREPILADADGRTVVGLLSLTLLGALGGHGKTTWAIDLFLHMAAGIDFAPFKIPAPVSVLVIENEGPEQLFADKLAARLEHFPHELKSRLDVCTFDWGGFSLADEAHRGRLIREIAEQGYDLVFGDPLDSLGIEGVGSPEDTRKFLALMKQTGLNKSVAWWLNTHPRKEETKEALNEIAGAWGGKPDTVFLLRMLDDDRTQLRQPKLRWARRGKGSTLLFAFDPDTEAFSFIGEQSEEERDYLAEVRGLLADGKWRIVKEIAAPHAAGGIAANDKIVKKVLDEHPDVFESRTGDEAKALGRKPTAALWQLRPDATDEDETQP